MRINTIVMELQRDVPLEVAPSDLVGIEPYDGDEVKKLFDFLEFRNLYERLSEAFAPGEPEAEARDELRVVIDVPDSPDDAAGPPGEARGGRGRGRVRRRARRRRRPVAGSSDRPPRWRPIPIGIGCSGSTRPPSRRPRCSKRSLGSSPGAVPVSSPTTRSR